MWPARSSFFNHELYRPKGQHLGELQHSSNLYSYVDEVSSPPFELCLTINLEMDEFLAVLRQRAPQIRYVALHPRMLVAMCSLGDYAAARASVDKGHVVLDYPLNSCSLSRHFHRLLSYLFRSPDE
jgi:hypothetical protein